MRKNILLFILGLIVLALIIGQCVAVVNAQEPVVTIVCESVHTFVDKDGTEFQKCKTADGEILPLVEGEVERLSPSEAILTVESPQVDNTLLLNLTIGGAFVIVVCTIIALSLSKSKPISG